MYRSAVKKNSGRGDQSYFSAPSSESLWGVAPLPMRRYHGHSLPFLLDQSNQLSRPISGDRLDSESSGSLGVFFSIVGIQELLPQPDRFGSDLNQLVVIYKFQGLL